LVPNVQRTALQQQKGVGNFHGTECCAEQEEEEVPEEEEVKAILSRGMQRPKMALQGAWEVQLQMAWTHWHLKKCAAVLPVCKPLKLLVTKLMGLSKFDQLSSSCSFQAHEAFKLQRLLLQCHLLIVVLVALVIHMCHLFLLPGHGSMSAHQNLIFIFPPSSIFPVIKFQYFDSTTSWFPSDNLFVNCSKHHFFLEAMKWLIADMQNWQDCKN